MKNEIIIYNKKLKEQFPVFTGMTRCPGMTNGTSERQEDDFLSFKIKWKILKIREKDFRSRQTGTRNDKGQQAARLRDI